MDSSGNGKRFETGNSASAAFKSLPKAENPMIRKKKNSWGCHNCWDYVGLSEFFDQCPGCQHVRCEYCLIDKFKGFVEKESMESQDSIPPDSNPASLGCSSAHGKLLEDVSGDIQQAFQHSGGKTTYVQSASIFSTERS